MATQVMQQERASLLNRVLSANGIVTTVMGAALLIGAGALPTIFGLPQALIIAVGVICLGLGPLVLWLVATNKVTRQFVWALAISEVLWVAASIEALMFGWLAPTSAGWWAVIIVADIYAIFAALEFYALRKRA